MDKNIKETAEWNNFYFVFSKCQVCGCIVFAIVSFILFQFVFKWDLWTPHTKSNFKFEFEMERDI